MLLLPDAGSRDLRNLVKVLVLVAAYVVYVKVWERRPARELALAGALRAETLAGLLLGGLLFVAVMAVLAALGAYVPASIGTLGELGAITAAMLAESRRRERCWKTLVFRLLLLRLLERSFGSAWALAGSSLAFGLAHLGNDGATPLIGVMLGLELGLLFGAAYLLTRRIWLCTAIHLAWNFVQGAVFSIAVSGHAAEGWLRGSLAGPAWLTGGALRCGGGRSSRVVLCLVAAVLLLRAARRSTVLGLVRAGGPGPALKPEKQNPSPARSAPVTPARVTTPKVMLFIQKLGPPPPVAHQEPLQVGPFRPAEILIARDEVRRGCRCRN